MIGNDSAPLHLAAAAGTPTVAIFGPTAPALGFGPYGVAHVVVQRNLDCRPCSAHGGRKCPKGHFRCMKEIDAAAVLDAARQLLRGQDRHAT